MITLSRWMPVVALALVDDAGRFLLQQRPAEKHHGGLWEFPGGKVDAGEAPRDALSREIAEELGLDVKPADCAALLFAEEERDGGGTVVLMLYRATFWRGTPEGREGQCWGWFTRDEAIALALAPMDRVLVERISD